MEKQDTIETKANVVSLFNKKAAASSTDEQKETTASAPVESFEDVMARNARNKERLAKERSTANKSVLRSYKIKN